MRELKRLFPGRSAAISATVNSRGDVVTEAAENAAALRDHWGPTFAHKSINRTIMQHWLQDDAENPRGLKQAFAPLVQDPRGWHICRRDIRRAVELSGESTPGPHGVPYAAWRTLGGLGVGHLTAVAKEHYGPNSSQTLSEAFPLVAEAISAFHAGVMVFIPKKVPQTQEGCDLNAPVEFQTADDRQHRQLGRGPGGLR